MDYVLVGFFQHARFTIGPAAVEIGAHMGRTGSFDGYIVGPSKGTDVPGCSRVIKREVSEDFECNRSDGWAEPSARRGASSSGMKMRVFMINALLVV